MKPADLPPRANDDRCPECMAINRTHGSPCVDVAPTLALDHWKEKQRAAKLIDPNDWRAVVAAAAKIEVAGPWSGKGSALHPAHRPVVHPKDESEDVTNIWEDVANVWDTGHGFQWIVSCAKFQTGGTSSSFGGAKDAADASLVANGWILDDVGGVDEYQGR